MLAPNRTEAMT